MVIYENIQLICPNFLKSHLKQSNQFPQEKRKRFTDYSANTKINYNRYLRVLAKCALPSHISSLPSFFQEHFSVHLQVRQFPEPTALFWRRLLGNYLTQMIA